MQEECKGCYLIRIYREKYLPEQLTCQHETLDCPCKTCLVKVTCDMVDVSRSCESFTKFNIEHSTNSYWAKRQAEQYKQKGEL
jgi:hypothetical protein